ncbi:MAG: hypothetical protein OIF48_18345 [Silicimonas sp.]|nr:hypothetical protein [Silicimonas sp.]
MRYIACCVALWASPVAADVNSFETPSGNIECSVGESLTSVDIICTVIQRSGPPARPRPSSCGATWGHHFEMFGRGPVTMKCTPPPRNSNIQDKAPYGQTGDWGEIVCHSERTGLTCRNADGHGFFLSRRSQQVF